MMMSAEVSDEKVVPIWEERGDTRLFFVRVASKGDTSKIGGT